ncbi:MAG: bifunctional riboflavin kinase/FAD synthetase [Actinomycetota bacterium]|nr:bifunctional riboflavin kinase/FAD synthetase [Actinomycetota bacterium]
MKIIRSVPSRPPAKGGTAITIGNFDGVHAGHRALIARLNKLAEAEDLSTILITFDPHPQKVLHGKAPDALTTFDQKMRLLEAEGLDRVVVIPFTAAFSRTEPEAFMSKILVKALDAKAIVIGANFRFGRFARGDTAMLKAFGKNAGFTTNAVKIAAVAGRPVSSREIRHALVQGDVSWAAKALGTAHALPGKIIRGHSRGKRLLGYPTANLKPAAGMASVGPGVYAGEVTFGQSKRRHAAAISVGTNPTFGVNPLSIEAFLLDFDSQIYGSKAEFRFVARLRDQKTFSSPAALSEAIAHDVVLTRKALSKA